MEKKKTEGILLSASTYLERQKILKVFTSQEGLITLFAKKTSFASLYSPFLIGEWVYEQKTTDLYLLKDASLIQDLSDLRQNYAALLSAGKIAQNLLKSQLNGKPSPLLYALTAKYFEKLQTFPKPENLAASFDLKLLLHEGLLNLQETCSSCTSFATHLNEGESVCSMHRTAGSIGFSKEEWQSLYALACSRRFEDLEKIILTENLKEKIRDVLESVMSKK